MLPEALPPPQAEIVAAKAVSGPAKGIVRVDVGGILRFRLELAVTLSTNMYVQNRINTEA